MAIDKSQIEGTIDALKRQRDELALQIHLGNMEVKEEFDQAKDKLNELVDEYEPLKAAVEESAGNVWESMKLTGEEVLASFERIKKSLS